MKVLIGAARFAECHIRVGLKFDADCTDEADVPITPIPRTFGQSHAQDVIPPVNENYFTGNSAGEWTDKKQRSVADFFNVDGFA